MRGYYHWPPRPKDWVYDQSRQDMGLWPHGQIVSIDKDWVCADLSQVFVLYEKKDIPETSRPDLVLAYDGEILWRVQGRFIKVGERWSELDLTLFKYLTINEENLSEPETSLETYLFSDFEGRWSSSQGGNARWELD